MDTLTSRFIQLITRLKADGHIRNEGEFAKLINETQSGLTAMKTGKKRIRLEHIDLVKKAVPSFNANWLLKEGEEIYEGAGRVSVVDEPVGIYVPGKQAISGLMEQLDNRLGPEGKDLVIQLKQAIDRIILDKDELQQEFNDLNRKYRDKIEGMTGVE